jgi:hypothetical protein
MKAFVYTRTQDTWHPDLGILKPGINRGPDATVDLLLAAGAASGDYREPTAAELAAEAAELERQAKEKAEAEARAAEEAAKAAKARDDAAAAAAAGSTTPPPPPAAEGESKGGGKKASG